MMRMLSNSGNREESSNPLSQAHETPKAQTGSDVPWAMEWILP